MPARPGDVREVRAARVAQHGRRRPCGWAEPPAAVFLDRDGVINYNRHDYVKSWSEFEFLPGVLNALARLREAGRRVIVVTNQSAVGRELISAAELAAIHDQMRRVVASSGGAIEEVLVCPHRSDAGCACRKPRPGLFLMARDLLGVDLRRSVLVGDHADDLAAAAAAGCIAMLVLSGRTALDPRPAGAAGIGPNRPDGAVSVASDLSAAVDLLLEPGRRATTSAE